MPQLLPTSEQDFERLIKDGFVYVDKTEYIWKLVEMKSKYFLSRPRRFGKSLFVSTLDAYFSGKKELFRGLAIEEKENARGDDAWTVYPIIHFSLSSGQFYNEDGLERKLANELATVEKKYGLKPDETDVSIRFSNDIADLYEKTNKKGVVVLVDEYDNPLLPPLTEKQINKNRELYKAFFSVLKDQDRYLKFVFFTGVTKFSKVSIFSDLNQLKDISMSEDFSEICGFTEAEIKRYFTDSIKDMAGYDHISEEECINDLRKMYDGYHFAADSDGVYNPYSLMNAFQDNTFDSYWFESGTPGFLIDKLIGSSFRPEDFVNGVESTEKEMKDYRIENANPVPLFYQSGYLTIKKYDREFRTYSLGFPNMEVRRGFFESLVPYVLGEKDSENSFSMKRLVRILRNGDTDSLYDLLYSVFASIPYIENKNVTYESVWRNQIYLIFELAGEFVTCEQHTSQGRSDCVVETADYVYLFEFKVDKNADEALAQIESKDYAGRYKADSRQVIKIGADFSSQTRNIDDWKVSK
ncbi:MAG: AAA family ATPase [Lachnospiraceae bacterium]|nr:AAA family ATPase [Lachnospiraceae bacterium]MDY2759944.1 AAA family ATPase [Lachnospiraceae bacterium]